MRSLTFSSFRHRVLLEILRPDIGDRSRDMDEFIRPDLCHARREDRGCGAAGGSRLLLVQGEWDGTLMRGNGGTAAKLALEIDDRRLIDILRHSFSVAFPRLLF
jgi:hypothetical protein